MPDSKYSYFYWRLGPGLRSPRSRAARIFMMGKKQLPLIYNPTAGTLRRDTGKIERLTRALAMQGIAVRLLPTTRVGDGTRLAAQSVNDGAETVIVCGCDGTINEAAQSLVGTETALAVLPCGTANVL